MNASPSPFSAHSDVLDAAVPEDAAGKERLLTELKNRGKAAVTGGAWPDAQALYEKALLCCGNADEANQKAILYSNIALVQGKMNHWPQSKESALEAIAVDPAYTKGWWRLGQAHASLKSFEEAVKALDEAAKLEPSNKALQKELNKQKENAKKDAAEKAKQQAAEEAAAAAATTKDSTTSTNSTSTSKERKTTTNAKKASSSSKPEPMQVDEDETKFTKSEHVKGYKIVNGKKTSYFHNELSEEAKALIGDIAPKKLEAAPSVPVSSSNDTKGTSAWNKAGKFILLLTRCLYQLYIQLHAVRSLGRSCVVVLSRSTLHQLDKTTQGRGKNEMSRLGRQTRWWLNWNRRRTRCRPPHRLRQPLSKPPKQQFRDTRALPWYEARSVTSTNCLSNWNGLLRTMETMPMGNSPSRTLTARAWWANPMMRQILTLITATRLSCGLFWKVLCISKAGETRCTRLSTVG